MTSSPKLVPDEVRKSIQTLILPPVSLGLSTQAHHSETGLGRGAKISPQNNLHRRSRGTGEMSRRSGEEAC